jgi:hypothetical protein
MRMVEEMPAEHLPKIIGLTPQALPASQARGGLPRSRARGPFGVGPLPHP